ncbi:hypothetical protein [Streptomyces sp. NPDC058953]|uniref:hypothetical protein n=1 Tax=Streptomyces sp. NPDC058953 TaxID=3346676 RepID=UPI0036BC8155
MLARPALPRPPGPAPDDLDRADDEVLDFVDGLADTAGAPLVVVVSAGPRLLRRRPGWGGGKPHATTLTLDALSDAAVDELIDCLLSSEPGEHRGAVRWFQRQLARGAGLRPDERRRSIRALLGLRAPAGGRP